MKISQPHKLGYKEHLAILALEYYSLMISFELQSTGYRKPKERIVSKTV